MTNLLLISNSKSLLDKKLGEDIDKFDGKIGRFNLYEIEGYEDHVGSRTDYILQRSCDDIIKRPPDSIEHVFLFITYCHLSPIMRQVARDYQRHYGMDKTTVVDIEQTYVTHQRVGLNKYGSRCSIGVLAIDYLVEQGYQITLLGWGSLEPNHYFKRQPLDSGYHNFVMESSYINTLKERGKVKDFS